MYKKGGWIETKGLCNKKFNSSPSKIKKFNKEQGLENKIK